MVAVLEIGGSELKSQQLDQQCLNTIERPSKENGRGGHGKRSACEPHQTLILGDLDVNEHLNG